MVTFHEWGHYWVAKKLGVKALRFSVGFGKPFWSKYNKAGTEFAVAPIPLGGYVRFVDEREGNVADEDLPYAFNRAPVWKRILIVLAGPMANFLLAILVYAAVYMMGVNISKPFISEVKVDSIAYKSGFPENSEIISVNGNKVRHLEDFVFGLIGEVGNQDKVAIELIPDGEAKKTIYLDVANWKEPDEGTIVDALGVSFSRVYSGSSIGYVSEKSAAEEAGIRVGDKIIALNETNIEKWSDITEFMNSNGSKLLTLSYERDGYQYQKEIAPKVFEQNEQIRYLIGISPRTFNEFNTIQYGLFEALQKGSEETWTMLNRITSFIGKLVTGKLSIKNLGGPVGIAQGAGQVVQAGMVAFLFYLAMISVNLGFVNLLPIPMLDGGHLMYYLAELIRGKPVSEKIMELGMRIGIILLLTIMAIALYNDINRTF